MPTTSCTSMSTSKFRQTTDKRCSSCRSGVSDQQQQQQQHQKNRARFYDRFGTVHLCCMDRGSLWERWGPSWMRGIAGCIALLWCILRRCLQSRLLAQHIAKAPVGRHNRCRYGVRQGGRGRSAGSPSRPSSPPSATASTASRASAAMASFAAAIRVRQRERPG